MISKLQLSGVEAALNISRWSAVVMCFSLAISRSLFMTATAVLIVSWLFSGHWSEKLSRLVQRPAAIWMLLLLVWMFVSALWSRGSPTTIAYAANVQWKLLIIPLFVMVVDTQLCARRCWNAFGLGIAILLVHILLLQWTPLPWVSSTDPNSVFFNPLPQSVALALFCAWCVHHGLSKETGRAFRLLIWIGFLVGSYVVFFLSLQRIGYLSWTIGCGVSLYFAVATRSRWIPLALFVAAAVGLVTASDGARERIQQGFHEVWDYKFQNNYSSIGSRLHMWYVSGQLVWESPVRGHGLGSYPVLAESVFNDHAMCEQGCKHPHNQYIFYLFEFGMVGLGIFAIAMWKTARRFYSAGDRNAFPLIVFIVFLVAGLVESTLWYRGFFYLFAPLLGLVMLDPAQASGRIGNAETR